MKIIGNGQIAQAFRNCAGAKDSVIFASGVSDSKTVAPLEFRREQSLLQETIAEYQGKTLVYFSSCAVADENHQAIPYYAHKQKMERLIRKSAESFFIVRVPQLFGKLKRHSTLINYLYYQIVDGKALNVEKLAKRYLCYLPHLVNTVSYCLNEKEYPQVLNVGNPHPYTVLELIRTIELQTDKKAIIKQRNEGNSYSLDFTDFEKIYKKMGCEEGLGVDYFSKCLALELPG